MFTIVVCMRDSRRLEVARYKYATANAALHGRMKVMRSWKQHSNFGVLVSAVIPPR